MAILGTILKTTFELRDKIPLKRKVNGYKQQVKVLEKLLKKAANTEFGSYYHFNKILEKGNIVSAFQELVPTHDYNAIYNKWWHKAVEGKANICWPKKVKYFALSSGTSEASSKYIPLSKEMLKAINKASRRLVLSQAKYNLPKEHYQRGVLMIGGSSNLKFNGKYFEGDLSGIQAKNIPFYYEYFYKPGKKISQEKDWNIKLDEITKNAKSWDIGTVVGVPAWIQILFEKIIKEYNVTSIHDIWPNLAIYAHGGVSITPYKKGFTKLLGKPIIYVNTYLASEGLIAFQDRLETESCKMVLDNGIFYEFVPFNESNFNEDGNIISNPETYHINEVKEGIEYALLLSTCAGAWRYLIGDVIKFTSLQHYEITITGRTKQFLSLCGEHLSQDNMDKAIEIISQKLNITIKEYTVAGIPYDTLFAHHWYIGTDNTVDKEVLKKLLDETLISLNDDYLVERTAALKEIIVDILPSNAFYNYMESIGKIGGAFKFPRVLKNQKLDHWISYLKSKDYKISC